MEKIEQTSSNAATSMLPGCYSGSKESSISKLIPFPHQIHNFRTTQAVFDKLKSDFPDLPVATSYALIIKKMLKDAQWVEFLKADGNKMLLVEAIAVEQMAAALTGKKQIKVLINQLDYESILKISEASSKSFSIICLHAFVYYMKMNGSIVLPKKVLNSSHEITNDSKSSNVDSSMLPACYQVNIPMLPGCYRHATGMLPDHNHAATSMLPTATEDSDGFGIYFKNLDKIKLRSQKDLALECESLLRTGKEIEAYVIDGTLYHYKDYALPQRQEKVNVRYGGYVIDANYINWDVINQVFKEGKVYNVSDLCMPGMFKGDIKVNNTLKPDFRTKIYQHINNHFPEINSQKQQITQKQAFEFFNKITNPNYHTS